MIVKIIKRQVSSGIRNLACFMLISLCGSVSLKAQNAERVILPGNYPDPSVVCVNNEYYIVSSSGLEVPGLPVWHSKDLQHWTKIAYGVTSRIGDIWAPDLAFFDNKWYIFFTALTDWGGMGNFIISADKPEGPWSKPVRLNLRGIDPGHLLMPDGKLYVFMSGGGVAEIERSAMKVIGEQRQAYKSWPIPGDFVVECNCTEGPKPFYHNGYIYLVLAEGGTTGPSTSHMAVAARAKSVDGPWEFSPYNPVIRTNDKSERWWSKGHGTVFQGTDKKWYMVFHAYENSYYTAGRQVLITPIEWTKDGWFREANSIKINDVKGTDFIDNFDSHDLNLNWCFYNDSASARISLNNGLIMNGKGSKPSESNPLLFIPPNKKFEAITKVTIQENCSAGIALYYNDKAFWGLFLTKAGICQVVKGEMTRPVKIQENQTIYFKLLDDRNDISYFYSLDGAEWTKLERSNEISGFNANTLGGYRSIKVGLITYGEGQAIFNNFKYKALDN
jgi:xylan 1,4-beta-xylosidase